MRAVVVEADSDERRPRLVEKPKPTPDDGEVLLRILRVGIDGTDHEVIAGGHGGFPADDDHLVLGHEAVGVVEASGEADLEVGDVVVPTVRRPPPDEGTNEYFERGEADMAPEGAYVERGIVGAHGFMAEYVTTPAEFLVPVPKSFAEYGFLIEPLSNAEKAFELAEASRSTFHWDPESAFVLGNGPLGLLSLAALAEDDRFDRLYGLGRRDRPDPTIDVIEDLEATYVDSRETPVPEFAAVHEPVDLIVEATGYAPHAFECIHALAPNGVAALLGIPGDSRIEIDGGAIHRECVLHNKAVVGSVNSNRRHFEAAKETLSAIPEWVIADLLSAVYPPEEVEQAFDADETAIKTAIEFDS